MPKWPALRRLVQRAKGDGHTRSPLGGGDQRLPRRILELLKQIPAAITVLRGRDLVIEFAHPLVRRAVGGRPLEGRPLLEAVPEFVDQPHVARMRRVLETGEASQENVVAFVDADGSGQLRETYWRSNYQPVHDETGKVDGLLLFDIEITGEVEQRRRLELLQQMTSALSLALTVEDVARIVVEEGTGKLAAPRGGVWRLSDDGATLDLLYDKGYSDALREGVRTISVASPLPLADVLRTGRPCWITSRAHYAHDYDVGSAQTYPLRSTDEVSFFCAPLLVEGRPVGCLSFNWSHRREFPEVERRFIDALADQCAIALHRAQLVARERAARDAAVRGERRFQAVFEHALDGIILHDVALRIVDINPAACAILQRSRAELVGLRVSELLPAQDRRGHQERAAELREVGRVTGRERRILRADGSVRTIEASQVAEVLPGIDLTTFRDIEDRKRAEDALRFLEEASRLFAGSRDTETTLAAIARLAVPRLADWVAIDLLEPDGTIRHVVVEHADPKKIALAHAMREHRPLRLDSVSAVAQVIRTGEPHVTPRITDEMLVAALASDPEYLAMVREAGLVSLMVIPLPVHGKNMGAITFAYAEQLRLYGSHDVGFAQELARRAGAAFENALAYRELRQANLAKDVFLRRSTHLQTIASALVTATSLEEVAQIFARTQREAIDASICALYVIEGDALRGLVLDGVPPPLDGPLRRLPLAGPFPASEAARTGAAVWLTGVAAQDASLHVAGIRALVALPLSFGNGAIGAVSFGFSTERSFDEDERRYFVGTADLWAQAVHRVQLVEAERDALRERLDALRAIAEALPQMIWAADEAGDVTYVNARWTDYTGMDAVTGHGWEAAIHPDDRERVRRSIQQSSRGGNAATEEFRVRRHDGVYRWFLGVIYRIADRRRATVSWLASWTDIDDQIRSRTRVDRLYRLTTALATTLTTSSVASTFCEQGPHAVSADSATVWILDPEQRYLCLAGKHADRVDLTGRERILLASAMPISRVARERAPAFFPSREALFEVAPELRGRVTSGANAWAQLPLVSAAGQVLGVASFYWRAPRAFADEERQMLAAVADQCAVALDRARAYEAEAAALRKKDEFLAMLGHELRNPLAPILTATSLIRLRGVATERELGILERQGRHLVRLVDDLLDVSRISAGKLTLRKEPIEVAEVVAQAIESVSKSFEDKRLRLDTQVPVEGLAVQADRERLVQVFTNLLVNAAKFTPGGRGVWVHARRHDGSAVVEVRDEGEGIAPELLPAIFDVFTQGPQASDRRDGGLGLGLAIARSIVEGHGGTIEAQSDGPDRGTTVVVRLPLDARAAHPSASVPSAPRTSVAPAAPQRILVVDDNVDAAEVLATLLESHGYEAHVAADGPSGIALAERIRPHAAILDIGLPGMDGYELAKSLRERLGDATPPLFALTGYAQAADRERALASGFREHFAKPIDPDRLVAALARVGHKARD